MKRHNVGTGWARLIPGKARSLRVPSRGPTRRAEDCPPYLLLPTFNYARTGFWRKTFLVIGHFLPLSVALVTAQTNPPGNGEFIFAPGSAPFASCHASTIAEASGGLVAAWFGGKHEGSRDVSIWLARFENSKWTAPQRVADGLQADRSREPCWNPVLFQPTAGPLLLFYKVGPSPSKWWGMLMSSENGGVTWSKPQRLPDGILGPIKDKPVELPGGEILCPSSTENHGWQVHFEQTLDLGKTWQKTGPINDGKTVAAIQPTILKHPDNRLQALARTRQGKIFETWSDDGGRDWAPLRATSLPNPNSGIDAVTLKDGRQLLVYNHTRKGRSPLNVAVSADGKNWQAALVLENSLGEYSYPAVIQTRDGKVHITYTWRRVSIRHVVLDPANLKLQPMPDGDWPP